MSSDLVTRCRGQDLLTVNGLKIIKPGLSTSIDTAGHGRVFVKHWTASMYANCWGPGSVRLDSTTPVSTYPETPCRWCAKHLYRGSGLLRVFFWDASKLSGPGCVAQLNLRYIRLSTRVFYPEHMLCMRQLYCAGGCLFCAYALDTVCA